MTRRTERQQRQQEFARLQAQAILSVITATTTAPGVAHRIRELAAAGVDEVEIAHRTGMGCELVRRTLKDSNAA